MKKVLLLLLFLPFAICGLAQDSLMYSLDEIVVSASRWCQQSQAQPVKVTRLSFDEANTFNPQTAADVLGLTGEVFIQKSQYGGGSPMIRGFATNRLLYSIDGVRMNTAIFRSGNIQNVISLDPFAIADSEVLFGPGAVGYGSDAIGGAMVFSTLEPRLANGKSPLVHGAATVRTATASNELTAHVHAGVGWKRWALLTSLTYSSYGDLQQAMQGADGAFKVLLSHDPSHWRKEVVGKSDIDLMLAGHTHAMQVMLFGWSPSALIYKEWGGLYSEGWQSLYVNRGLGQTVFKARIGAMPEITLLELKHK